MDAAVTTLKFESKSVIPTDPRTKLFLTVTVSTIMITGGTGGINNVTAAHWYMEFYPGSRSRDLYAHAPRIYHGILSGEYDNGQ